jgi:hypothetical protein
LPSKYRRKQKPGKEIAFSRTVSKDEFSPLPIIGISAMEWSPRAQSSLMSIPLPRNYTVRFTAEGFDGEPAQKTISIAVSGSVILPAPRRYSEPRE